MGVPPWQVSALAPLANHAEESKVLNITPDRFLYIQQLRKRRLQGFCLRNPEEGMMESVEGAENLLSGMIVNEKLQMLYCMAGATGTDTWENLLEKVKGEDDVTIETPVVDHLSSNSSVVPAEQSSYNLSVVEKIFRTYTKVVFVREPFERLISAYLQGDAGELTFDEFLEDVLGSYASEDEGNPWKPVVRLCHPCFIKYDYIVLHDFFRTDVFHLMKRIGIPDHILRPEFSDAQSKLTQKWFAENLFSRLTREQVEQISEVYRMDLEAFPFHRSLLLKSPIVKPG
uniref:Carbohydrate sulfotransferase n=1 Tax=Leptobrachium leishanense TaxID=445787 RepID=A0A8C5PFQ6_9ANUR